MSTLLPRPVDPPLYLVLPIKYLHLSISCIWLLFSSTLPHGATTPMGPWQSPGPGSPFPPSPYHW